jgi:hypothetical protein
MGAFYTNITLRGPSQEAAAEALEGREAYVSPAENGVVVVFDSESEDQSTEVITSLASRLSKQFACPALAVINHDDDVLFYVLYESGVEKDRYDSTPEFEGGDPFARPKGGDAKILCSAFGSDRVEFVSQILEKNARERSAMRRHAELLEALGMPSWAAGTGYNYIYQGEAPPDLEAALLETT